MYKYNTCIYICIYSAFLKKTMKNSLSLTFFIIPTFHLTRKNVIGFLSSYYKDNVLSNIANVFCLRKEEIMGFLINLCCHLYGCSVSRKICILLVFWKELFNRKNQWSYWLINEQEDAECCYFINSEKV